VTADLSILGDMAKIPGVYDARTPTNGNTGCNAIKYGFINKYVTEIYLSK
jgi:hypothetical protein